MTRFGAALQLLRAHGGVSLRGLGGQVGVSAAYLSRVEHGHDPPPTPDRARAIAEALRIPAPWLASLVDDARGDSAEWLRATPIGRRLAAELRRRDLGEAQLARVLAFVLREFPVDDAPAATLADALAPERVALGVAVSRLEDVWTIAALWPDWPTRPDALAAVGAEAAVGFSRGPGPLRAGVVVCDRGIQLDDERVHVAWLLAGVPAGPIGAQAVLAAARMADPALSRAVRGARAPSEVIAAAARHAAGSP